MAKAKKEAAEVTGRKPNPDAQNGVPPPKAGTNSAAVWAVCDKLAVKAENGNPKAGAVIEAVLAKNEINEATIKTQLARWRTFHGLTVARA